MSMISRNSNVIEKELEFPTLSISYNNVNIENQDNIHNNNNNEQIIHHTVNNDWLFEYDEDEIKSLVTCKWIVINISCLFISIISWDIVGDKIGWDGALWVPLAGLLMILFLWIINYFNHSFIIFKCI